MTEVLPILLPALLLGSVFSAVAGSGLGIILIIVFTLFFDIQSSVIYMSLVGLIIQPTKAYHFYKYADWQFVRRYIALGLPCSYIGGQLLFDVPLRALEISIAVLCLIFIVLRFSKWKFTLRPTKANVVTWGAINGIQGGVIGLGNFLRNPVLLAFGLTKQRFLGTASMISIALNIGKMAAYVPNVAWTTEIGIMLGASVPPIVIGITVGKRLHKYITDQIFENLLLVVIFAGAIKLLLFS